MTLVCETAGKGNLRQRQLTAHKKIARTIHPPLQQPAMRRHAGRVTKGARKVPDRQSAFSGEAGKWNVALQVRIHQFFGVPLLPGCEAALWPFRA